MRLTVHGVTARRNAGYSLARPLSDLAARCRTCVPVPSRTARASQGLISADRIHLRRRMPRSAVANDRMHGLPLHTGTAVVFFKRSSTKLVLQSCTLGCMSNVSEMKRA